MWSPRHALVTFFLCVLAASLLFGCRAFEPEAIIVNRLPETYIVGSPAETSGAYFHFHVYWYGTDSDGFVERYVWALTDTSIQDIETDDDEEDQRFNPGTNASTLEIGTYTSRTDTVFDFQIGQGANLSYDMTLHMVAMDDRGEFDRTPARLHFFSNALGNPEVDFYRVVDGAELRVRRQRHRGLRRAAVPELAGLDAEPRGLRPGAAGRARHGASVRRRLAGLQVAPAPGGRLQPGGGGLLQPEGLR